MKKLILLAPLLLLPVPGHSQGVQMPNADTDTSPPSLHSPELKSLNSHPARAVRYHRPRRPLRRHRPALAQPESSLDSTAVPQLG